MQWLQLQVRGTVRQAVGAVSLHSLDVVEAHKVEPYGTVVVTLEPWPDNVAKVRAWYEEWRDTKTGPTVPGDLLHWALVDR